MTSISIGLIIMQGAIMGRRVLSQDKHHIIDSARTFPVESNGACIRCGEIGPLGDDICVSCWDKDADATGDKDSKGILLATRECEHCGHRFILHRPREPYRCEKCMMRMRPDSNFKSEIVDMPKRKCKVCGHEWYLKLPREPRACPNRNCGSKHWETGSDNTRKELSKRLPKTDDIHCIRPIRRNSSTFAINLPKNWVWEITNGMKIKEFSLSRNGNSIVMCPSSTS